MRIEEIKNPAFKTIQKKEDGYAYYSKDGLCVIQSIAKEKDGNYWIHTSFSRRSRMPEYKDMKRVKEIFIGDRPAYMIFPEKKYFVNIHPYCLHYFTPVDGGRLPDFSLMGLTL